MGEFKARPNSGHPLVSVDWFVELFFQASEFVLTAVIRVANLIH